MTLREGDGWSGIVQVAERLDGNTFLYVDMPNAGLFIVRATPPSGSEDCPS
jgi:hypothetical protein